MHTSLLAFHGNYVFILHSFCDTARYWSKIAAFDVPNQYLTPNWGDPVGISPRSLTSQNQNPRNIVWRCLHDPMFSHFGIIPACGRRSDRRTDRQTYDDSIYCASITSRGKNTFIDRLSSKFLMQVATLLCEILLSDKTLSYRRGTARRPMLANSCYVSRGMGDRKVSNSKMTFKVIQGHWQWCHSIYHIRFPISVPLQPLPLSCTVDEILSLISWTLAAWVISSQIQTSVFNNYCILPFWLFAIPLSESTRHRPRPTARGV